MSWFDEEDVKAGSMSLLRFGDKKLFLYYEATRPEPEKGRDQGDLEEARRMFVVELWANSSSRLQRHTFATFEEAFDKFSKIKIDNAVTIAMDALGVDRTKLMH